MKRFMVCIEVGVSDSLGFGHPVSFTDDAVSRALEGHFERLFEEDDQFFYVGTIKSFRLYDEEMLSDDR